LGYQINKEEIMGYIEELGANGVNVADVFAQITDEAENPVMIDARGVLEYITMVAQEIVFLAQTEPENTDYYEAMARPILVVGTALRAYVAMRRFEVPDDIEGVG
jgi:hypothetical protein